MFACDLYLAEEGSTQMKTNAVCWFEIYVDDMMRAKTFYESVLNVELARLDDPTEAREYPQPEMWSFPMEERPGASGAICKMEGVKAGGNSTLVYFDCEDCAVEESRVEDAGGQVKLPKMAIGQWGFISVAEDTEGNMIGFHSMQ
jgi:predicted enzyme related to lactoylglutathione lyase